MIELVEAVKNLGMETCVTLGMLKDGQAQRLKEAGLDYYNHNLDTAEDFYPEIISTRTYQDRLDTLDRVQEAGLKSCVGGIIGLGESRQQRAQLIAQLANRKPYPESVPINKLVKVAGTPMAAKRYALWPEQTPFFMVINYSLLTTHNSLRINSCLIVWA